MYISGPETRRTPEEFQARLTSMFGVNQFGGPNFKVVWGQSEFILLGNLDERDRPVYREKYLCHGQPCWNILRWKQPEFYGSPDYYFMTTYMPGRTSSEDPEKPYDSAEGFYVTGDYPWRGRYEIVMPLMSKEMVDGKLVVDAMELTHYLIDGIIPLLLAVQDLTLEELRELQRRAHEAEEKQRTDEIAERMTNDMPAWWGPTSYAGQLNRTALLDRKMFLIQQAWDRMSKAGRRPVFNRGLALGERPSVAAHK